MPLYFAYGSNMDRAAMARRCPASTAVGLARLARHRLFIMREGYASVVRDPRRDCIGLLWHLALADMPALDRYEGVGGGLYVKAHLPVLTVAGSRRALVYLGRDAGPGVPRPGYLEAVLLAAREAGLPPAYLAELARLGPRAAGGASPAFAAVGEVRRPAVTPRHASPLGTDLRPPHRIAPWKP